MRSLTTSEARMNPATGGTNETLPGTARLAAHVRYVPGGQTQLFLQLSASVSEGLTASSVEYTTLSAGMPRFLSSRRITRASGQTEVA